MPRLSKQVKPLEDCVKKVVRNPKCARCRNHGFVVQLKGHSGKCPFFHCKCWKCSLITERTKIMAFHRRIKKNQTEELNSSRESQSTPRESVSDKSDSSGQSTLPKVMAESVRNMPSRRTEENSKAYAGLKVKAKPLLECAPGADGSGDMGQQHRAFAGDDARGAEPIMEDMCFYVPSWHPHKDRTPPLPADYIFAEKARELMPMPFPMKLYSPYPNSYAYQTFLVDMSTAGPDAGLGFPHFQSASIPCLPEVRASQEYRVPLFSLPSMAPQGVQEDLSLRQLPSPAVLAEMDMHNFSSQLSEVSSLENDLSQDTP